ncbi:Uncharacterised protein [Mycobacteroides abscessus subsp. abscessus]|nr:Uncharacterised protein [Mycobacteroides abscessus subsp. abscessus]
MGIAKEDHMLVFARGRWPPRIQQIDSGADCFGELGGELTSLRPLADQDQPTRRRQLRSGNHRCGAAPHRDSRPWTVDRLYTVGRGDPVSLPLKGIARQIDACRTPAAREQAPVDVDAVLPCLSHGRKQCAPVAASVVAVPHRGKSRQRGVALRLGKSGQRLTGANLQQDGIW